jgi:integrase
MSVYKPNGSPFYHYDFGYKGRRFYGSTKLKGKREAERLVSREIRPACQAEVDHAERAGTGPLTWGEARDRYWNEIGRHHKGEGARNTQWSLTYLDREIGRGTLIRDIRSAKAAEIVARRRGDGVANATVNRSVTEPLRKVLRYAEGILDQPLPKIEWKKHMLPEPKERVRELFREEEVRMLDNIRPDYEPIFAFSLGTGVRLSGCVNLQWSDIDWGTRTIRILWKGGHHYTIPLSARMRAILWPLQGRHPDSVFTYTVQRTREGRKAREFRPITKAGLKTEFRRARMAAGIPSSQEDAERGYRWHDNRHTRATRLLRQTGNLKMVQKVLGHQRIETTAKYAHVTMDDLREALDAEAGSVTASPEIITGMAEAERVNAKQAKGFSE